MIGDRLGPYEITGRLGAGGMGEVWRAVDTRLRREAAIKILPAAFAADRDRLARFEREAQLLAQLHHPNIASIFGLEEHGATRALAMELVEGETLEERLRRGALPLDEALAVARQIAEALEAAHEKGIVHRDLKPGNVKLTPAGEVKVLDFGLAKALDGSTAAAASGANSPTLMHSPTLTAAATELGVILGTAAYMSPEQARGKPVDRRADVWAFGCVLWEMLTGRRLFAGETVSDTLVGVLKGDLDFAALPAETPPAARRLLRRCLERDPRSRLHDIADARLDLADAERERTAPGERSGARVGGRWAAPAAALVAGAALGALAMALWSRAAAEPAAVEPITTRTITFSGADEHPSMSPDGRLVAFASRRDGRSRIWLKDLATGGEQPLTAGEDDFPRFSPDGTQLLFVRAEGGRTSAYRQPLVGAQAQKVVDGLQEADWSPDGERIVFVRVGETRSGGSEICVAEVRSGATDCRLKSAQSLFAPRFTPDGKELVAVESQSTGNSVDYRIVRLASRGEPNATRITVPGPGIGGLTFTGRGSEVLYAQAASIVGDDAASVSRVVVRDLETGRSRTIFHSEYLFPAAGFTSVGGATTFSVAGPGRLVYSIVHGRERLWTVALDADEGGPPALLATTEGRDRQPTYSRDGRSILFTSNRSGNLDLWLLDRATGALRQLTDDRAQDWDPAFTADGRGLLWSSDRGGHFEIWTASLDGTGRRQVSNDGLDAENPVASPDGRFVYYWSANVEKQGIWRVRSDGSEPEKLIPGSFVFPEVSPDGRHLAYVSLEPQLLRSLILVADAATGAPTPFRLEVPIPGGGSAPINVGRLRWAPDGRSFYFIAADEAGRYGVNQAPFRPDGAPPRTQRVAGFRDDFQSESFAVSPDGRELAIAGMELSRRLMLAENVPGVGPAAARPARP